MCVGGERCVTQPQGHLERKAVPLHPHEAGGSLHRVGETERQKVLHKIGLTKSKL